MTSKIVIMSLFFAIYFTSCKQIKTEILNQDQQTNIYKVDTSIIAILPFEKAQYLFFKDSKPTDLTNDDFLKIETILNQWLNHYNLEQEKQFNQTKGKNPAYEFEKDNFIIDLTRYKRQYVATINSKGEKEVWVNCFCNANNLNWRTEIIKIKDGGKCYFNLKVNLKTVHYYEPIVNGNA